MKFYRSTLVLLSLFLLSYSASAQENELTPQPGVKTILSLFDQKPLVAIGEVHAHQQLYDFLTELVQEPDFTAKVNDIVIESGSALYQETLDNYIMGKTVSEEALRKVWMNTSQSPVDPWSADVYAKLLGTIRDLNKELPQSQKIRVLAGDPPLDWSKVHSLEDYNTARGSRNTFYAQVVMDEVMSKGRKALLINGGAHFGNHNPRGVLVNQRIEKVYPNSVTVVMAPAGLGRANRDHEPKLANWPMGAMLKIENTWIGELAGPSRRRMAAPSSAQSSTTPAQAPAAGPPPTKKQDMFDYLLYFGGFDQVAYGNVDADIYQSDSLWKELNRRSKVRFNHELIPETRKTGVLRPEAYR